MNNKNKSLRLTERDIEYKTWIAEQQEVRLDTLQLLIESGEDWFEGTVLDASAVMPSKDLTLTAILQPTG